VGRVLGRHKATAAGREDRYLADALLPAIIDIIAGNTRPVSWPEIAHQQRGARGTRQTIQDEHTRPVGQRTPLETEPMTQEYDADFGSADVAPVTVSLAGIMS
jgi:hypothetical protein